MSAPATRLDMSTDGLKAALHLQGQTAQWEMAIEKDQSSSRTASPLSEKSDPVKHEQSHKIPATRKRTILRVIVGPMGSGKTAAAQRLARDLAYNHGARVLCVGSKKDLSRQIERAKKMGKPKCHHCGSYDILYCPDSGSSSPSSDICASVEPGVGNIETHYGSRLPATFCDKIIGTVQYETADWIVIDEGQFFEDLVSFVSVARDRDGKSIIISTLDARHDMTPFIDLAYLEPRATFFEKLTTVCDYCTGVAAHSKALFDKTDHIVVGGMDMYASVCYEHFLTPWRDLPPRVSRQGMFLRGSTPTDS